MLSNLIQKISPDIVIEEIKRHPMFVLSVLQRLEIFKSVGDAMPVKHQVFLSSNLSCVNDFLKSADGKKSVCLMMDTFKNFVDTEVEVTHK